MNYYIDFDSTLYNTPILTQKMLNLITDIACSQKKFDKQVLFDECKSKFNRKNIYEIYEFIEYFSDKYALDKSLIINNVNELVLNSNDLVFEDSIDFLNKLHNHKHNVFLLSYAVNSNKFQTTKILGSGLVNFFDAMYITSKPKYELDIDYSNGIFIDDNPKDLLGLYSKNPKKLIRLRRPDGKYYSVNLNIDIEEYPNFTKIEI